MKVVFIAHLDVAELLRRDQLVVRRLPTRSSKRGHDVVD
jgi:hypothetical protein